MAVKTALEIDMMVRKACTYVGVLNQSSGAS